MNKQLILLATVAIFNIQAQDSFPELFKNSWKKDFKTRDEFVKHLREVEKRSVKSYVYEKAQDEEEQVIKQAINPEVYTLYASAKAPRLMNPDHSDCIGKNLDILGSKKETILTEDHYYRVFELCKKMYFTESNHLQVIGFADPFSTKSGWINSGSEIRPVIVLDQKMANYDSVIMHELAHLRRFHHPILENLAYFSAVHEGLPFTKDYLENFLIEKSYVKQIRHAFEYVADSISGVHSLDTIRESYDCLRTGDQYLKEKNIRSLEHPEFDLRIKNLKYIGKLLEAEDRWFKTQKADEMYGNVAYENAWVKHCEQLEQQKQDSKLKQWLGYFKKTIKV